MSTNTDQIYWPLTAIDVHALKYIAMQTAVDLVLYGTCLLFLGPNFILRRRYRRTNSALRRCGHHPGVSKNNDHRAGLTSLADVDMNDRASH